MTKDDTPETDDRRTKKINIYKNRFLSKISRYPFKERWHKPVGHIEEINIYENDQLEALCGHGGVSHDNIVVPYNVQKKSNT